MNKNLETFLDGSFGTTFLCLLLYMLSFQVIEINSRTSTLWKLNAEDGKIISAQKNTAPMKNNNHAYRNHNQHFNQYQQQQYEYQQHNNHINQNNNKYRSAVDSDIIFDIITSTETIAINNQLYNHHNHHYHHHHHENQNTGDVPGHILWSRKATTTTISSISDAAADNQYMQQATEAIPSSLQPQSPQSLSSSSFAQKFSIADEMGILKSSPLPIPSQSLNQPDNKHSSLLIQQDNRDNHSTNINNNNNNNYDEALSCGKPVNFTYYDELIGIAQRFNHPINPEPEVAYLFMKRKDQKHLQQFDVASLERRLRKAQRDKPRSVQLFNQIGNFWRIKGDTKQAIECFRKALAITPTNSDVLLNLARVLFHMQYLDDAIHLTRKSLEVQTPNRSAWKQYFTLGEIFKAYGHFQESILHLRHALELHPNHELISKALYDVENIPTTTLHGYTILIIVCLVLSVLLVILTTNDSAPGIIGLIGGFSGVINIISSSNDSSGTTTATTTTITTGSSVGGNNGSTIPFGSNFDSSSMSDQKVQKHFNRAMAMRSLKGFTSSRPINKYRK